MEDNTENVKEDFVLALIITVYFIVTECIPFFLALEQNFMKIFTEGFLTRESSSVIAYATANLVDSSGIDNLPRMSGDPKINGSQQSFLETNLKSNLPQKENSFISAQEG